jgi:hypothetical protein
VRKPNGTIVRSFKREIAIPVSQPGSAADAAITVFQELRIRPGEYTVSAVLSSPDDDLPLAATRSVVVPEIPRGQPFLVGPILGRRGAIETTSTSRNPERPGFEPRLSADAEQGETLDSLTLVCIVRSDRPVDLPTIARAVTSFDGPGELRFDPVSARLAGDRKIECHEQLDIVATASLAPGRYEMNVVAETSGDVWGRSTVEFSVRPASE